MNATELDKLLAYVERLADMDMDTLRAFAATGKGGRYNRRDAAAELGKDFKSRGGLIRRIVAARYTDTLTGEGE